MRFSTVILNPGSTLESLTGGGGQCWEILGTLKKKQDFSLRDLILLR